MPQITKPVRLSPDAISFLKQFDKKNIDQAVMVLRARWVEREKLMLMYEKVLELKK